KIDAVDPYYGGFPAVAADGFFYIFSTDSVRAGSRRECEKPDVRVDAAALHVGRKGIAVGREGGLVDENAEAVGGGSVERCQHQVQVDGEAVHEDDFTGSSTNQASRGVTEEFVVAVPRRISVKMPLDAVACPVVQFLLDEAAGRFRLKAERL